MKQALINNHFDEVLEPLGNNAANFFLAASLYIAHKISFSAAAALAELTFDDFNSRLHEHFNMGFVVSDEDIIDDIDFVNKIQTGS